MRLALVSALALVTLPSVAQDLVYSAIGPDPTFAGVLEATDPTRENGAHYDSYEVPADPLEQISITLTSDAFDAYLVVRGPDGAEWVNDDYEGSRDATVEMIAEAGGTYTVWASGFGSQDLGEYAVTVERRGLVQMDVTEGRLDYKDGQTIKGEFLDTHTLQMPAGQTFVVELLSLGFDGFLAVQSPSGQMWRNDDAGVTTLSRVGPVEGEDGDWTVHVTSVRANEVGAYDLRVITHAE